LVRQDSTVPWRIVQFRKSARRYFVTRIVNGWAKCCRAKKQTRFDVQGAKLSVCICTRASFPDRAAIGEGRRRVMVNTRTDAWYGH